MQQRSPLAEASPGSLTASADTRDAGDGSGETGNEDDGHDGKGELPLEGNGLGKELSNVWGQQGEVGQNRKPYSTPKPAARKAVAKPT